MRFEVVDRDERLAGGPGDALRRHRADDQPADQPGPGGAATASISPSADAGLAERAADQSVEMVEMRPRRDLGHHAAIGRVLGELRLDQIGADPRPARAPGDHRDRGLVAAGLDAEDDRGGTHQRKMARRCLCRNRTALVG